MNDIEFTLYDPLHVQINTDNYEYLLGVQEHLTDYVSGYRFMPRFKSGGWNGKISLFKKPIRSFPYGLMLMVLKYTKSQFPELSYTISDQVKSIFNGIKISNYKYDLSLTPYDYQQDCIEVCVNKSKGIVVVATAGGKSLIISYIIDIINKVNNDNKSLIIVPTLQLVDQFKGDLTEYGIPHTSIGMVNSSRKEFDQKIVVSTWQSLKNQLDKLPLFNTVIIDETHGAKADKLSEILECCTNANYRFGLTGTLPTSRLDKMNVLSYIGPVLRQYNSSKLAELGYISKCTIKQLYIEYEEVYQGTYTQIRDQIFQNPYRLGLIKHLVGKTKNSILILIEKVEKEGCVLEEMLKESFPDKDVIFLSGKDSSEDRDAWRKEMNDRDDIVCIATYPIFQQGVNIKSLRTIVLASSTKSFIRVIQSLGRALRKHVSKELGGAELYDICDKVKYLEDHADKRDRHYTKEGHTIETYELKESDGIYIL